MIRPFREELKYLVHHSTRTHLLNRWSRYLVRAEHLNADGVTPILSQYYDSPNMDFYHEKIDGERFRNKVRLRTYGYSFGDGGTSFLELKQRRNFSVRKFRYKLPGSSMDYLLPENWRFEEEQSRNLFGLLRDKYRLRRTAQVWYLREAYQARVESDVRITFDNCLVGLHPDEALTRDLLADRTRSLMQDNLVIMEVKATKGIPPWVTAGVLAAELVQRTVPKYVVAMEALGIPAWRTGVYL